MSVETVKIGKKTIGPSEKTFIIAEISANHGGSLARAIDLIRKAKECGADAVKFQLFTADTHTIDVDNRYFRIKHPQWGGQTLYQLYKKVYTPWHWFKKLKKVASDEGIIFFASAADKSSVDFLEELKVPCHKLASFELVDLQLISYIAKTHKPLMLSTGMANRLEIKDAINAAKKEGNDKVILLRCISSYPADPKEMNLRTILDMKKTFQCPVGLSDHTMGTSVSVGAVALGANVVEKHFTQSRALKTADSFFSMEPAELKQLVKDVRLVKYALGDVYYGLTKKQKESLVFRRSLFVVKDIRKGERLTEENVRSIRPANGLKPKLLGDVLGKKAVKDIKKGTPLTFSFIK